TWRRRAAWASGCRRGCCGTRWRARRRQPGARLQRTGEGSQAMRHPNVMPFHHAESGTWSYVLADPSSGRAALVDPVLDFDPKSGRTATTSAERLLDAVRSAGLQVDWILETHAHADHLSAGHWLR